MVFIIAKFQWPVSQEISNERICVSGVINYVWKFWWLGHGYLCLFSRDCDLHATFEWPEKWLGRSVVSPTQKALLLCNCCSTTLVHSLNDQSCWSSTTGHSKEAEWRQRHCHVVSRVALVAEWRPRGRHSHRSMDTIGHRRHNSGTTKAETSQKLIHNVRNSTHILPGD